MNGFRTNFSDTSLRYIAFSNRFCDRSHWNYVEPPEHDDHDGDAPGAARHAYRNVEAFLIRPQHQNEIIYQIMLHQQEHARIPEDDQELPAEEAGDDDNSEQVDSSSNDSNDD